MQIRLETIISNISGDQLCNPGKAVTSYSSRKLQEAVGKMCVCVCVCVSERERERQRERRERQRDKDRGREILLLARILLFIFVNKRLNLFVELLVVWSLPVVLLSTPLP